MQFPVSTVTHRKIFAFSILFVVCATSLVLVTILDKFRTTSSSSTTVLSETYPHVNQATIAAIDTKFVIITETPTPTLTPRPTKTPVPTPYEITGDKFDELITKYANKESVDPSLLKKIAVCESGLNPMAQNGPYAGLFQFSQGAWTSLRNRMNLDNNVQLRFHPEEAIKTAAYKLALNGRAAWPNCAR